jgi:hypothetical protein
MPKKKTDQATTLDVSNLAACAEEVRLAALDSTAGPPEPTDYDSLLKRIEASTEKLPPLYRDTFAGPFLKTLKDLGRDKFTTILLRDPSRERSAGLMLDLAQAILQNGEGFEAAATDGFQEVVSDLYDGFLSAEDRRGVNPPDKGAIPPLVKWGDPDAGPYTWPVDAASSFKVQAGVVSLPPANAHKGLLAWSALGHETGGHDIIHADTGLEGEIQDKVRSDLTKAKLTALADYWSERIDETASDVLGILNMGPAAGIGLIGFFRGLNAAFTRKPVLRNDGPEDDPHPADIVRGFLAASTVRMLEFKGAAAWGDLIEAETMKDVKQVRLSGKPVTTQQAKDSAEIVAQTIVGGKMKALEMHSFGQIQNWRDADEGTVASLVRILTTAQPLPDALGGGVFAAHAVSAAVMAALEKGANIQAIFDRMVVVLKRMHDANPSWGPLFVRHPGNMARDRAYLVSSFYSEE